MIPGFALALFSGVLGFAPPLMGQDYFPQTLREASVWCESFGGHAQPLMSDFKARWYARHLSAAGERPLSEADEPTLRFTWLRTFEAPVVIRLDTRADGRVTMTATELSGKGGYEPGIVARRVERQLSAEEIVALTRTLATTAVLDQTPGECRLGMDGSEWIIEATGPEGYRYVERWTPRDGPVREVGVHLIGLTGWTYDNAY
ncbi:MAG: hypothetical protein EON87_10470 [Brevundimonas sp.]|nr:MAG: hypothetical protein EON87_10470 [Brevundimonas sp.]